MIQHIVIWKLKQDNKNENAIKIKEKLTALKSKIKELKFIRVDYNSKQAPDGNYDVILTSHFDSFENLNIYQAHPEHVEVLNFIKPLVESRVAIDFEE